jgi:hypothetical protein
MKKLFLVLICFLALSAYSYADIHITVYGKGGIVVENDGTQRVCPETDTQTCSTITIEDGTPGDSQPDFIGETALMVFEGITYEIVILEFYNLTGNTSQGAHVQIQ